MLSCEILQQRQACAPPTPALNRGLGTYHQKLAQRDTSCSEAISVETIEAPNARTMILKLKQPYSPFFNTRVQNVMSNALGPAGSYAKVSLTQQ